MNKNKGFTLIELLVVIAIIGILSSVVLASLNTARAKAKDAAVKSMLSSMRAQAELFYNTGNTYLGVCGATVALSGFGGIGGPGLFYSAATSGSTTPTIGAIATTNANVVGILTQATCHDLAGGWAAEVPVQGGMWCVDYTSASKLNTSFIAASAITC